MTLAPEELELAQPSGLALASSLELLELWSWSGPCLMFSCLSEVGTVAIAHEPTLDQFPGLQSPHCPPYPSGL